MGGTFARTRPPAGQGIVTIWHNPRCSKSRQTLELLRARGLEPQVREYLKQPPSAAELRQVLRWAQLPAAALVRSKDPIYAELGLGRASDEAALVQAMASHPVLIERPVVIRGQRAVLGRPPEQVLSLLD
jgi:arsenate reductase